MRITSKQLKRMIKEELDEMRIFPVAGYSSDRGESIPKKQPSLADAFAEKYKKIGVEVELIAAVDDNDAAILDDEGKPKKEKVFFLFDDDLWSISAADVPKTWWRESNDGDGYIYHTGEYVK